MAQVVAFVGTQIASRPELAAVLARDLLGVPRHELLLEILPVTLPRLVVQQVPPHCTWWRRTAPVAPRRTSGATPQQP